MFRHLVPSSLHPSFLPSFLPSFAFSFVWPTEKCQIEGTVVPEKKGKRGKIASLVASRSNRPRHAFDVCISSLVLADDSNAWATVYW